jgi:hypothetical protein
MKNRTLLSVSLLLLSAVACRADLHPERLAGFRLHRFKALSGFAASKPVFLDPLSDKPAEAAATLNLRLFHGPSELNYSVVEFSSDAGFSAWDTKMRRSAPGWVSPAAARLKGGVRENDQVGSVHARLPIARAVLVGRYIIRIAAYQHPEMIRRNPSSKRLALSDSDLSDRLGSVKRELVRRALAVTASERAHPGAQERKP